MWNPVLISLVFHDILYHGLILLEDLPRESIQVEVNVSCKDVLTVTVIDFIHLKYINDTRQVSCHGF